MREKLVPSLIFECQTESWKIQAFVNLKKIILQNLESSNASILK